MLPEPLYFATLGYGQSGRVRTVLPCASTWEAMIISGATPSSTQLMSGSSVCVTYQRSRAFRNKKDKFDESYLEDFVGRSFVKNL